MSTQQMLINNVPGEECRVAIVSDGQLEDLHCERANASSHVGNIYVGKVVNVEAGIQAAFIDFGLEHNGFLHISDLHPQYFSRDDADTTESIGRKTPRRDRPPINRSLKRGQEILVQVIKEGIGTKGPTVTSYLSIPGRYLVMMPAMDHVGVSRKIEDDELRRKMRDSLDQLDLPSGFGFILRTAGMDRGKTELKRDLAYLNRLWRDIERRRKAGKGPRLLYAESDLLLRSLRDMLSTDIDEIVIDDKSALRRASHFLKIFAPRSAPNLIHYDTPLPIYHAFGVEKQIQAMHSRRVDLPSGGYLYIDEAEALVAIDVNSGKMRNAGDAETTAYKTNLEAIDSISRQMRLRDLGGIVVLDLIDMRSHQHRREIEQRLRARLKVDPARSKALPISQFGLIELTRQRMRGSMRTMHFTSCPDCDGHGVVQRPDSVASTAIRELACLLEHDRVRKVELVVSPRVASELLTHKRRKITRLEMEAEKEVLVRVSETVAVDRVTYYAYDDRGADVDVASLPTLKPDKAMKPWVDANSKSSDPLEDPLEERARLDRELEAKLAAQEQIESDTVADADEKELDELASLVENDIESPSPKRKRSRRRRKKKTTTAATSTEETSSSADGSQQPAQADDEGASEDSADKQTKSARRRKRRRRSRSKDTVAADGETSVDSPSDSAEPSEKDEEKSDANAGAERPAGRSRRRGRRGRGRGRRGREARDASTESVDSASEPSAPDNAPREPVVTDKPAKAASTNKSGYAPRGDSWDLDPAEVVPARAPRKSSKSNSTAKKVADTPTAPADNHVAADVAAEVVVKESPAKKKASSRKKASKKKASKKATSKKKSTRKKKTSTAKKTEDAATVATAAPVMSQTAASSKE